MNLLDLINTSNAILRIKLFLLFILSIYLREKKRQEPRYKLLLISQGRYDMSILNFSIYLSICLSMFVFVYCFGFFFVFWIMLFNCGLDKLTIQPIILSIYLSIYLGLFFSLFDLIVSQNSFWLTGQSDRSIVVCILCPVLECYDYRDSNGN